MILLEFELVDGGIITVVLGPGFAYGEGVVYLGGATFEVKKTRDEIKQAIIGAVRGINNPQTGGIVIPR